MEKIYWQSNIKNFGDELNNDFFERALEINLKEYKKNESILGIGSILNYNTSNHSKIHVLGTGSGYPEIKIKNLSDYNIWFLRGPLTASAIGVDKKLGICDPAIIVPQIYKSASIIENPVKKPIFIPHYFSALNANWKKVCMLADISYRSPMSGINEICEDIQRSNLVITESLHGAILADAYRIPWILVATPPVHRSPFKWKDWLSTIDFEYKPIQIPWLWTNPISTREKIINRIKQKIAKHNLGPNRWTNKQYIQHGESEIEKCAELLIKIKTKTTPKLSDSTRLQSLQSQINEKLTEFKRYVIQN